jgi:dTMP kinase
MGTLARTSTHRVKGLALACLVAADRYHHLDVKIRPALARGYTVICDRYLPSSLVLQHLDGVPDTTTWSLNAYIEQPDLTILLDGDSDQCQERARQRGTYSRFHDGLTGESQRYRQLVPLLNAAGHPTITYDIGNQSPDDIAGALTQIVLDRLAS